MDFIAVAAVEDVEAVDFIVVAAVEDVEAVVEISTTGTFLAFLAVKFIVEADGFIVVAAGEDVEAEVAAHCAFVAVSAVKDGRKKGFATSLAVG